MSDVAKEKPNLQYNVGELKKILDKNIHEKFFGYLTVKFENGKLTIVKKVSETIKP